MSISIGPAPHPAPPPPPPPPHEKGLFVLLRHGPLREIMSLKIIGCGRG